MFSHWKSLTSSRRATKIKKRCKQFISIHSDNDQWVSIKNSDLFKEKLKAEVIIAHNMKHFSGDDGVNELPIALDAVLKTCWLS